MAQHFSLAACDVVGFDLDHTLCRYNLPESAPLIYNSFARFLVKEKGYDKELLTVTPEDWDFCCKGLALDLEDGTFIKLAENGTVLRASHGTKMMTPDMLAEAYGKKEWKYFVSDTGMPSHPGKYYFYDNYFDLPGALLCARVADSLTKNSGQKTFDFWKDIVAGIQHNFKMSAFKENCGLYFPEIKRDPGKYLHSCPESVRNWLQQLKSAGKILLLITSSHSDYCKLLCEYTLGDDFADLFDIVITNALKPGFFSHSPSQRPFYTLKDDEEQESLPSLDKPGWYSQGNSAHLYELLKKMTSKPKPKVVYFGDSMHSDIFPASHYSHWETVLILEELRGEEGEKPEEAEPLEKKGKYEFLNGKIQRTPWFIHGLLTKSVLTALLQFQVLKQLQNYPWTTSLQDSLQTVQKQLATIRWSIIPMVLSNDETLTIILMETIYATNVLLKMLFSKNILKCFVGTSFCENDQVIGICP
ncbi:5'-nucleotidase domain-containing protein 1 isoform X4 [Heterocephalus glaber]|uniref:5'-nucleotidase domain-containing protein 1 n=1 Tax=Heterocephalus glaber TaxID=10181 RepID=A0AAX6S5Z2_HETGA|nr:5'-nucleotidase domain-containing protein 1 isoform X4 [Heterocephalus glaber]